MRLIFILLFFIFFSCENEETVFLPKSNFSIVTEIKDLSPVYIFFKVGGKDTMAEVNRRNTIISTNWVFNIDKRLPLRFVIPEVMKLQDKKRNDSAHKNELAQNYYTYTDSIKKNLAFLPFTDIYYKIEKPKIGAIVYFKKNQEIVIEGKVLTRENLKDYLKSLPIEQSNKLIFCFDKDLDYGSYIQHKIVVENLNLKDKSNEEYIY